MSNREDGQAISEDELDDIDEFGDDNFLLLCQGSQRSDKEVENTHDSINSMEKAKIFALETELKTLKNTLKGKEYDLRGKQREIVELESKNMAIAQELKEKGEQLELSRAKEVSLDDVRKALEIRVKRYGEMFIRFKRSTNESPSQKETRLEKTVREKTKK